jgi:hypothetical protein
VDDFSLSYSFCPGKATWYEDIAEVFDQCRIALETGILPSKGSLNDQSEMFCEAFPIFLARWKERQYNRIWTDVRDYTKQVLEALFPKGKKGK